MVTQRVFPRLPDTRWWALRKHFQDRVPQKVTASLVATVLSVSEKSAAADVKALRDLGLIDDAGALTNLANDWRSDETYARACAQMLDAVYPEELRDALPPPNPDRETVQSWFSRTLMTGAENARQLAAMYVLIAAGDVTAKARGEAPATGTARVASGSSRAPRTSKKRLAVADKVQKRPAPDGLPLPQPQIAVQVNIDPAMTADQIDQVFKSMAEHLYGRTT